ncbi:MAG: hypothetical protein RLO01_07945 [Thalassobaculaceae bacterium]
MAEAKWTYDEERRLFTVCYRGRVSLELFMEARAARRSIGVGYGAVRLLIDASEADLSELTADHFKAMESTREPELEGRADRAAGVVGHEADLGIAELWAFYRNRSVPGSTAVFLSRQKALGWLTAEVGDCLQGAGAPATPGY